MAHLSGDERLIESFRNNEDVHAKTAEEVFGLQYQMNPSEFRRRAKVINFGIIYGLSAFGLAARLGISRHEAQAFIDAYFQRYQGVRAWLEKTLEEARNTGAVRTLFGRVRPIPDIRSKDFNARNFAERAAINSPIQGTAADIIKLAMIRVHEGFRQKKLSARMIMQVHDELVLELPRQEAEEAETVARSEMENAVVLNVPLVVDIYVADNWKDMK
jgi:DNA polymerase-1